MATLPNYVVVPCVLGPAQTATNVPNGAALFRAPTPQPSNVASSSGPTAPVGPQLWPLKL